MIKNYQEKRRVNEAIQFDGTQESADEIKAFCEDVEVRERKGKPPKVYLMNKNDGGHVQVNETSFVVKENEAFSVQTAGEFLRIFEEA